MRLESNIESESSKYLFKYHQNYIPYNYIIFFSPYLSFWDIKLGQKTRPCLAIHQKLALKELFVYEPMKK